MPLHVSRNTKLYYRPIDNFIFQSAKLTSIVHSVHWLQLKYYNAMGRCKLIADVNEII